MDETRFLGVFDSEILTHYIALGCHLIVDVSFDILPVEQPHKYRWFTIDDLLNEAHVHKNTKAYF